MVWVFLTGVTRRLQTLQPDRSLMGLRRLGAALHRIVPRYQGVVRLPTGVRIHVDTTIAAERWLMVSGVYHPAITNVLRQHVPRGGYCIDAGANLGFFTLHLALWVGPEGRVAAFEPHPRMAARIRANVALNGYAQVDVVESAVHDRTGSIPFYIAGDPAKSSIDGMLSEGAANAITVPATTLDEFVRSAGWERLDAIKMDIEGNDCRALLACGEALRRFRPFVVFEYKYDTPSELAESVFDLFSGLDYQLEGITFDGRRVPFDWRRASPGYKQIDVICIPNRRKPMMTDT